MNNAAHNNAARTIGITAEEALKFCFQRVTLVEVKKALGQKKPTTLFACWQILKAHRLIR